MHFGPVKRYSRGFLEIDGSPGECSNAVLSCVEEGRCETDESKTHRDEKPQRKGGKSGAGKRQHGGDGFQPYSLVENT